MNLRKDVYQLPDGDQTLYWYGVAVEEMKSRPASDPTSWYYQGAIHGVDLSASSPTNPNPGAFWQNSGITQQDIDNQTEAKFWNQCQHGTWYFTPWHRMYLFYFEQIVSSIIVEKGGPNDWALPFWNYSNSENPDARKLPPQFADPANPLYMAGRQLPSPFSELQINYVNLKNLNARQFIGEQPSYFGGPETDFSHDGNNFGGLEELPHNPIHVQIGGATGAMYYPPAAALDPIFWLHHSNIDRLWSYWLEQNWSQGNPTTNSAWMDETFKFHNAAKEVRNMSVAETLSTEALGYNYQSSYSPIPEPSQRVKNALRTARARTLVGASTTKHSLHGVNKDTHKEIELVLPKTVRSARESVLQSLTTEPDTATLAYIEFENITGKGAVPVYNVYVNTEGRPGDDETYIGFLALFGLDGASTPSAHHSGSGLNIRLEVSEVFDRLRCKSCWSPDKLNIRIEPQWELPVDAELHIGRISLNL